VSFLTPGVAAITQQSGTNLGILEWWGCNNNTCKVLVKILKPHPFNETIAIFSSPPTGRGGVGKDDVWHINAESANILP
jgi:hypothetical protein